MIHRTRPLPLAVTLAGAVAILAGCGSSPSGPSASASPTTSAQSAQPSVSATPSPTAPAVPTPAGGPVPSGFSPLSVTFVSLQTGFVLGTAPCSGSSACLTLLRTPDAGHTWVSIPAPSTSAATRGSVGGHGVSGIRFADPLDGWAFGPELWSTHDGGATWNRITLPGASAGASVMDLAASAGQVQAAVFDKQVEIESSAADHDAFTRSSTTIGFGAGPVPQARLVLHGDAGWLIEVDRTVVGGARLSGGAWAQWTPPCTNRGGDTMVDASSTSDLVAICNEGVWSGGPPSTHTYASTDAGGSFTEAPGTVPVGNADEVAASSPQVVVVAGHSNGGGISELLRTADGGATWTEIYHTAGTSVAEDLGFTSPQQGVVVEVDQGSASLLMTLDAGTTWSPVSFH